jgi:hypothetical protein
LAAPPGLTAAPQFVVGSFAANGSPPSGAYTPDQIQIAYGFDEISLGGVAANGAGETIGIVDAYNDPNIQNDLNTFDTQFGLPATTVAVYNQNGGTSLPSSDSTGGWELEESLDVEWAHAIAPAANIMLVEANSESDGDLFAAVGYAADHADVVSMSFAGPEYSGEAADDARYFAKAGVSFVAAAGDDGAPASYPATSPDVLAVGGTALTLGTGNVWASESGWSGSGGGPSAYEPQPTYQKGVVTQTSSQRANPDVAYDASSSTGFAVYDSVPYNGTTYDWIKVGGTSAGTPQWAALLAIADEGRALTDQPALDSANPEEVMDILYDNTNEFHDITTGTSTGAPEYVAGPGFDYVTGLGSPMANLLVGSLEAPYHDTLAVTGPTSATAGTSFSLTVTAKSGSGQTDTGYLGSVHFSSSDVQAGLPADFTFTAADHGTYTFSVAFRTAGDQSITVTDKATAAINGTLANLAVSPAPASQFVLSGIPSTTTAGALQTITVAAEDPYGNLDTDFAGTVDFATTDTGASLPATFTFTAVVAGLYVFPLTFETAGTQSVMVTDPASGISGTRSGIIVQPGAAQSLVVSGFPAADTAGVAHTVTVTAYDAYGNIATAYAGSVLLTSSDPQATLTPLSSFVDGQRNFVVTLDTAGAESLTATDATTAGITGTESNISVNPATTALFEVTGFPLTVLAGAAGSVRVTAYDAYGNVATGYTGTVALTSSDPAITPESYSILPSSAGTQSFGFAFDTAGPQSITATDTANSSITGTESAITVEPGAATSIAVLVPATPITAGTAFDVSVVAHDDYGNVATGFTGTVSFSTSARRAVLPSAYTFSVADLGTHTFAITLDTAGLQSVTAAGLAPSNLSATDPDITVGAAAAASLVVSGFPAVVMAGVDNPITVTAYDAFGNVAVGYTGTITLGSTDPQAVLPADSFVPADLGTLTLPVTLETVGSQSITATDLDDSGITGTESGITVRSVPQLTWGVPEPIAFGTPLGAAQLDASANVAGTYTYSPPEGTLLAAGGPQTLSVLFTPTNSLDYLTATATETITVNKGAPTVTIGDAGGQFTGQPFVASVTIETLDHAPASSLDQITPTVTYDVGSGINGTSLGSTPPTAVGTYTALATFSGDADYSAAVSAPVTFTIERAATSVNVALSATATEFGQPVTVTATVTAGGALPAGAITFFDGNEALATVALDGADVATFSTSALAVGSHPITATYNGDPDFLGGLSAVSTATVAPTATELLLASEQVVVKRRRVSSIRLAVDVDPSAPGGGMPTGEVTFELVTRVKKKTRITTLGRAVVSGGEASMTFQSGQVLQKAITIFYSGDANDRASTLITPKVT